ncbi:MAG TPA: MFS transporter, partial [Microlunatus sp.]|nr:MFS transporter [Microlunatus sp.]
LVPTTRPDLGDRLDVSVHGPELGTGLRSYLRLLGYGPASRPFVFAALARLTLAMIPLGILILVEHQRQSYAIAGLVSGAYAVGSALGTPLWGRLMDRYGQVAVLLPTSLISAALLVTLTLVTTGGGPDQLLIGIAVGVGLSYPAIGPALRSGFRIVLPNPQSRRVAFALDATAVELAFVCGPLLLSALLLPGNPLLPLLVSAGLLAGGGVAYCCTGVARHAGALARRSLTDHGRVGANHGPRTALAVAGVPAVLIVMLLLSVGFGQLDTTMAATADRALGGTEKVGILFAAIAGGSTVGGLVFGSRHRRIDERRGVALLLGMFGLFLGALAVLLGAGLASLPILLPVLFLTGLTIAPTLIMQQTLLDRISPAHRLNEAQALLSAANTTGAAVGTAIAGVVIDLAGVSWSFAGAAAGVVVAAVIAYLGERRAVDDRPLPES